VLGFTFKNNFVPSRNLLPIICCKPSQKLKPIPIESVTSFVCDSSQTIASPQR